MNILFLLYGEKESNTSYPIKLIYSELIKLGHCCIIASLKGDGCDSKTSNSRINIMPFDEVLKANGKIFPNFSVADIIHASTSRLVIIDFLIKYQKLNFTPLVFCVEDNERWLIKNYLDLDENKILALSNTEIIKKTPKKLSNFVSYPIELALADLVICLQDKLKQEVPKFIHSKSIAWPADISLFSPQETSVYSKEFFGISINAHVIVYHGGLNGFNRYALIDLCQSIDLINQAGIECYLIRTGPNKFNFLQELNLKFPEKIIDCGVVNRDELPRILSLSTLFIQPGRINEYEDLRLPSKVLDFLSMGKPVIIPNVNIANQFVDNIDAVILKTGEPKEIANACISLFNDPERINFLGKNARHFALKHFSPQTQALKFEAAYLNAISIFDSKITKAVWSNLDASNIFPAIAIKVKALVSQGKIDKNHAVGDLISIIELMDSRIKNLSDRVDELILANKETARASYRINENFITKIYAKVLNLFN